MDPKQKQGDDSFGFKLLKVGQGSEDVPIAKPASPLKKKGLRAELRNQLTNFELMLASEKNNASEETRAVLEAL